MAMNKECIAQVERGEGLGWAEGLWLVVVGEKLRLRQQLLLPPPLLGVGGGSFFLCCPPSFSELSANASLLQCEKEVREGTFMSLLAGVWGGVQRTFFGAWAGSCHQGSR